MASKPMDYRTFTNDSLTMMYEAVRGALAADDTIERQGDDPKFKVRDTPDWKRHAADLEAGQRIEGEARSDIDRVLRDPLVVQYAHEELILPRPEPA